MGRPLRAPSATAPAGPTPWGSWLTCEETEAKAGTGTLQKDHGYVFEVFADVPAEQTPLPIKAWGRAAHEAVVVEPSRQRVYLTEDASNPTGLLYRWTAPDGYKLKPHIAQSLEGRRRHASRPSRCSPATAASCPTWPTSPPPRSAAPSAPRG